MLSVPHDRRQFLLRTSRLTVGAAIAGLGPRSALAASVPELISRRVLFDNPDIASLQISPDGEQLAYLAPVNGVLNLWTAPVAEPAAARVVTHATDRNISYFYRWAHTNRHLVFFQERDGDENWRASSVDTVTSATVLLSPPQGVKAQIQELSHLFPEEMLFRHNGRDKRYFDIYRVNILTGAGERLFENNKFAWMMTDLQFRVRLGLEFVPGGNAECVQRQPNGEFTPFLTVPVSDVDGTYLLDMGAENDTLYMLDPRGRDKAALMAVDMATRERRVLAEDDEADISMVAFDPKTRVPLAAAAVRDRTRWYPLRDDAKEDLGLLAAHGGGDLEFTSGSLDGEKAVAFHYRDTASGEFLLVDGPKKTVRVLLKSRPALDRIPLQAMQPVVIKARDGLALNGYLTMPGQGAETSGARVPLVLTIHGGPYLRDRWGFNSTHQWLANRGYAALSVNYRGSTGFGKAFVTAADREWGGRMHDDLIDAAEWAVAQGFADQKRIGFYGASYGGYSALTAATKTPEVFACIVDIFGISNLLTFMATIPPYWGPWFSIWKQRLGDPATEEGRAFLRERSPISHVDRVSRPLLIAQGMKDVRVVAAESEQMVEALKQRGVPVTYVTFSDEGHGFSRQENRLAFYAVTEAFLAKHLGGRMQPIDQDFAGSTLKVEIGGELIPGLAR